MLDLLQITNDPAFAQRCDALPGLRVFVDLEQHGKAERQAGRGSFLSTHRLGDVGRVRAVLHRAPLLVRVNPLHAASGDEVDAVLAQGADQLMLPMFHQAPELQAFCALVAGRASVVALLETAGALASLTDWVTTPGLAEVFVGLNDLHLSLGQRFMFEPLAAGLLEPVAQSAHAHGLRFGFGGIARLDEGLLPGRDVLAEHLRLGSQAVILSRTFHRAGEGGSFEEDVQQLRVCERTLALRSPAEQEADRLRIAATITGIAATLPAPAMRTPAA